MIWKLGPAQPMNYENVTAAINEILLEELNVQVQFDFSRGDYGSEMNLAMTAGDPWDLCWTANWGGNIYLDKARAGAYLQLDDYLETYAPDIMATIPEAYWKAIQVDGGTYAMFNYQINSNAMGVAFSREWIDAAGIAIPESCTWEEFDALLAEIKAAYPDSYPLKTVCANPCDYFVDTQDYFTITGSNTAFMYYNAETLTYDWDFFMNDEWRQAMQYAYNWAEAGYIPEDALTLEETDDLWQEGVILGEFQRYTPTTKYTSYRGQDIPYVIQIAPATLGASGLQSTLTAINAKSEHPEKAIELFNYVFSHPEVANLLFYGIEGQDYEMLEDGTIRTTENCWSHWPWACGNTFIGYVMEGQPADINDITLAFDQTAISDPLFGFVFDPTTIEAEYAAFQTAMSDYWSLITQGQLSDIDGTLAEMHAKAEAAGAQIVEDEVNRQIQEWLAAQ